MHKVQIFICLISFFCANSVLAKNTIIHEYDHYIANSAPLYNISRTNKRSKINEDKIITITGKVMKVDCQQVSKFLGWCSIIIDASNIRREGYRYSFTKIFIPSDTADRFEKSIRKMVIFRGEAHSMGMSKDYINGERHYYIEFDDHQIYLQ